MSRCSAVACVCGVQTVQYGCAFIQCVHGECDYVCAGLDVATPSRGYIWLCMLWWIVYSLHAMAAAVYSDLCEGGGGIGGAYQYSGASSD